MRTRYNHILLSSVASLCVLSLNTAIASPQGGVVSAGSATISQNGKATTIDQPSQRAVLDWNSFDVAFDESVAFNQPSSGAIALNRIHDVKASQIDGSITANGHIMLLNQNGVVFGAGAKIDVGSLTVTTADIDNDDFMAGNYNFDKAGASDAAIINYGEITAAEAGLISLIAPRVENHGILAAKLGRIELAAADTFTLDLAVDKTLVNLYDLCSYNSSYCQ